MKIKPIKTKRFTLRPYTIADAKTLAKNIHNKKIARNTLVVPYPYTLKDAKTWLSSTVKEYDKKEPEAVQLTIDIKGEVVGAVGITDIKGHQAEMGYWLTERLWGKGMMTEAVLEALKFAFNELKLARVYAKVFTFNPASVRVLEKAGFKKEGLLKKDGEKDGKFFDSWLYAKINSSS